MELSLLLAQNIFGLFLIIFVGYLTVKCRVLTPDDSKVISKVVLYIVCPCTILNSFQIDFTNEKLMGLILSFIGAIVVHLIFIPLTKLLGQIFHFMPVEKATLIYFNAGNLIIPLVASILGEEWVLYTSGYMVVQTILIWTHGKNLVCNEKQYDFKKIILNVNVIAIMLGMIMFIARWHFPALIHDTVSSVGSMVGPLSMLVIGMLLGDIDILSIFKEKRVYGICFLRLIVYPLAVILAFRLLGLQNFHQDAYQILLISLLAASAPAAATITQFAQLYDKHPGYTSIMNVMSVIFCIITMPIIVFIYQIL